MDFYSLYDLTSNVCICVLIKVGVTDSSLALFDVVTLVYYDCETVTKLYYHNEIEWNFSNVMEFFCYINWILLY